MCLMLAFVAAGAEEAEVCSETGSCQTTQSHPLLQTAKSKHAQVSSHKTVDTTSSDEQESEAISHSRKHSSEHTIQQKSSMYYMDAWPAGSHDSSVANRKAQGDDSQVWIVTAEESGEYTIQQKDTGRYMDAWNDYWKDYNVVTRPAQGDSSQLWIITPIADANGEYTITQKETNMNLDAWETAAKDYSVVMRSYADTDDTQTWVFTPPLEEPSCFDFCDEDGGLNPDSERCKFVKCKACAQCGEDQPRCRGLCNKNGDLNPDHKKCKWNNCKKCPECQ
jgi:hypothetical protein